MLRGTLAASWERRHDGRQRPRTPAGTIAYPVGVPTFTGASVTSSAVTAGNAIRHERGDHGRDACWDHQRLDDGGRLEHDGRRGEGDRPDADVYWLGAGDSHAHVHGLRVGHAHAYDDGDGDNFLAGGRARRSRGPPLITGPRI